MGPDDKNEGWDPVVVFRERERVARCGNNIAVKFIWLRRAVFPTEGVQQPPARKAKHFRLLASIIPAIVRQPVRPLIRQIDIESEGWGEKDYIKNIYIRLSRSTDCLTDYRGTFFF